MEDDSRIMRECQRLSVGGFDDESLNSIQEYSNRQKRNSHKDKPKQNKPNHTFNSIKTDITINYININRDNTHSNHAKVSSNESISVNEIINDLKKRKENRLKKANSLNSLSPRSPSPNLDLPMTPRTDSRFKQKYSRFMLASNTVIHSKDKEIQSLQTQLKEKESLIQELQSQNRKLKNRRVGRHTRQKSMTQTQTERKTLQNVRWSLRAEITKMTSAQNDINRLLQSIGDTSMIHSKLKKIYDTVSTHKRKVSALEQSLNVDEFGVNDGLDTFEQNVLDNLAKNNGLSSMSQTNEQKDFEILSKQYTKIKLEIAELREEENEWNYTKKELKSAKKRCTNLMSMLEKVSDEKDNLALQIEELHAFISRHNLVYEQ